MELDICYDIAALLFSISLLFVFYYKKWVPTQQNIIFSILLWTTFVATLTDIIDLSMSSSAILFPNMIHEVIIYVYFIAIDLLPIIYTYYVLTLTGMEEKLFTGYRKYLFFVPAIIMGLIIVLNPFTNWLFYFENGRYVRSIAVQVLNLFAFYFLLFGVAEVGRNRHVLPKEKCIALASFVVFATVPVVIQMFNPTLYITMLGVVICLFLILMTIQNPEEIISSIGLLNRVAFTEQISLYHDRNERFVVVGVRIRDYYYFKQILGTTAMNELQREFSKRLLRFVKVDHHLFYLGKGHFAMFIPHTQFNHSILEEINKEFNTDINKDSLEVKLFVQLLVIECPTDACMTFDKTDDLAEMILEFGSFVPAMSVINYASDMPNINSIRYSQVENAIRKAVDNKGFEVYFQPIISNKGTTIKSAEALIRLKDDELGFISPSEFIPIAEKTGYIVQIGEYVFEQVCEFYKNEKLSEKGIEYIEVNISVAQCIQKNMAEKLISLLNKYDLPMNAINLEITESVAASSQNTVSSMMKKLTEVGSTFSMDDYGTGFSNISSLIDLPFKIVKIDKELIDRIDNDKARIAIKSTIAMLNELNFEIVAEGVETKEQAESLIDMGCHHLQGYLYSKPIKKIEFIKYIQQFNID
ncbi:MAG: EAL domain-containing protein [Anaerorhabdus sp.]